MSKQYPLIANAWVTGGKIPRNDRMFAEGNNLYSYGQHYVIARKLDNKNVLFNMNSNSATTNKQRQYTRIALDNNGYKIFMVPSPNESLSNNLYMLSSEVRKALEVAELRPIKKNMLSLKELQQDYTQLACFVSGGLELHPDYERISHLFETYRSKKGASKDV